MVLRQPVGNRRWLRPLLLLRGFSGRTVSAAGVPARRHRRPPVQLLVRVRRALVDSVAWGSLAQRVALCASFG